VAQMFAVVTAQVVKGAQLTSKMAGVPYVVGCMVPTSGVGLFAFLAKPQVAERANTILTTLMIGGFVALMCSTVATGNVGPAAASLFQCANWIRLIPSMNASWAVPVFINLLCFGQAMPLVVERMFQSVQSSSSSFGGEQEEDTSTAAFTIQDVRSPLVRARSAALVGSGVPLVQLNV